MSPTPHDIEAAAVRARADAEAAAIRGRAEVDAEASRAAAAADAAAVRGRAEVDADALRAAADADRQEAERVLDDARRRADELIEDARRRAGEVLAEAADIRRRTEQATLDRLLATRADLHDAIDRLSEVAGSHEPVVDLTDRANARREAETTVPLGEVLDEAAVAGPAATDVAPGRRGTIRTAGDPVDALVRTAIDHAARSASSPGRSQPFASDRPSRRREQLRDGRDVL